MKIDGDFILNPNALEIVQVHLKNEEEMKFSHTYMLHDVFLKLNIYGVGVLKTATMRTIRYPNMLSNDVWVGRKLRKFGWYGEKHTEILGSHFSEPDEFQVFRRFYSRAVKYKKKYTWTHLENLYTATNDPLYKLAMDATLLGSEKRHYPGSHNLAFDKIVWEEYNANRSNIS